MYVTVLSFHHTEFFSPFAQQCLHLELGPINAMTLSRDYLVFNTCMYNCMGESDLSHIPDR